MIFRSSASTLAMASGMRGAELEAERAHLVEVADRAVGDDADAAKGAVDIGLYLAPLGALAARIVEIVDHDDARSRKGEDEVPPAEDAGAVALDGTALGADQRRRGIAHHGPELGEECPDARGEIAFLARPHFERLDGIGHAGAGDLLERVDLLGRERHAGPPSRLTAVRSFPCASR